MEFAFAHAPYRSRGDLQEGEVVVFERDEESAGEKVVAHQDGDLVLPDGVDGCESAARVGVVDDVVVDQRRRVQDLHQRGPAVTLLVDAAAEFSAQEDEDGADLLPLLPDDVLRDQVDEADARPDRFAEDPVEEREVVLDG